MSNDDHQQTDINDEMRRQRHITDQQRGTAATEKVDPSDGDHRGLGKHKEKK